MPGDDDEDLTLIEDIEDDEEGADAGSDDDEGGSEAAGQEDEAAEAEEGLEERRPSRATSAVQKAKAAAREATAKADRLEREMAELRAERARQQEAAKGETPEQEAARLSLMTAEERIDYKLAKATRENERQLNMVRFQAADMADKAAFEAKGAYDPRYKKYGEEVEALLKSERQSGRDFPRETILRFVLGSKVMANTKAVQKQRATGRQNVDRQRAAAGDSRSDRSAPRSRSAGGNSLADLEKRLEGVNI